MTFAYYYLVPLTEEPSPMRPLQLLLLLVVADEEVVVVAGAEVMVLVVRVEEEEEEEELDVVVPDDVEVVELGRVVDEEDEDCDVEEVLADVEEDCDVPVDDKDVLVEDIVPVRELDDVVVVLLLLLLLDCEMDVPDWDDEVEEVVVTPVDVPEPPDEDDWVAEVDEPGFSLPLRLRLRQRSPLQPADEPVVVEAEEVVDPVEVINELLVDVLVLLKLETVVDVGVLWLATELVLAKLADEVDVTGEPPLPLNPMLTLRHRPCVQLAVGDCDERLEVLVVLVQVLLPVLEVAAELPELLLVLCVYVEVNVVVIPPGRVIIPTEALMQRRPLQEGATGVEVTIPLSVAVDVPIEAPTLKLRQSAAEHEDVVDATVAKVVGAEGESVFVAVTGELWLDGVAEAEIVIVSD
ncbi:MAG: hypothetical protein Q9181_002866 [Wetmoreana brouardii]